MLLLRLSINSLICGEHLVKIILTKCAFVHQCPLQVVKSYLTNFVMWLVRHSYQFLKLSESKWSITMDLELLYTPCKWFAFNFGNKWKWLSTSVNVFWLLGNLVMSVGFLGKGSLFTRDGLIINGENGMRMSSRVRMATIVQCYCSHILSCVCFWVCVSPPPSRHFLSKWNYLIGKFINWTYF